MILKENSEKKFDIVLMNPPFNLGIKFFNKILDISNKVISIQPTKWILTDKQNKKITEKIDKCYCDIETLNGNEYFDIYLFADLSINYVDNNKEHKLIFNGNEYNKCSEITKYSLNKYLTEFNENVKVEDSIWDHIKGTIPYYKGYEKNPNKNWWCIKIQEIRGHVSKNKSEKESYDFYTIISNDNDFINKNKGKYSKIKEIPNRTGKFDFGYFAFNTENELNNFIRYLKTDFVRTCLRLSKTHSNQFRGCFKTIPWFDFSDEHFSKSPREIDDWLFKKYNISDKIRKHIEEILPDYYGIRK